MSRIRILAAAACAALVALALTATASTATPTLVGTVGPGFTITLTKGGKKVKSLKRGTYKLTVRDRSASHDFHLRGPGLNKIVTGVGFVGTKSITVKLRKGGYVYVCDPHARSMKGNFIVT
jgi:plastocyanin